MTTIQTNKLGLDVVDIQVECTGEPQTDMFFQEPVLDPERDYVLGVSEISVPLASENPITTDPTLLQEALLELKRKHNAQGLMLDRGHADTKFASSIARFKLSERNAASPADLLHNLSLYFYGIEVYLNSLTNHTNPVAIRQGVQGQETYKLQLTTTPSGVIRITANANFWKDYCFEVSRFGLELLGMNIVDDLLGVCQPQNESRRTDDLVQGANNTFVASDEAQFNYTVEVRGIFSIFRYAENRLRLEIDADLAIPSNILVDNGVHKLHYNIASYAIPHKYTAIGTIDHNPVVSAGITHDSHIYVGNAIIKGKETPTTDWYKLMSAANVQNMRLHIILVRRVWDRQINLWRLTRDKLQIAKDATWFITLKFVEQF